MKENIAYIYKGSIYKCSIISYNVIGNSMKNLAPRFVFWYIFFLSNFVLQLNCSYKVQSLCFIKKNIVRINGYSLKYYYKNNNNILGIKKWKGAITTAVDRGSKLLRVSILSSKKPKGVADETLRILQDFKYKIHTITSDNGLEFVNYKDISKTLNCDYNFCHLYSLWKRVVKWVQIV